MSAQLNAQSFDGELGPGVGQVDSQFANVGCNPNSVGPIPVPLPIPTCSATSQQQLVVLALNTLSGADNRITRVASANNQESFVASFDALVDPVISFAPGFDATGYSIELSGGVGNSVPEPGTALLLSTAIATLVRLRRRAEGWRGEADEDAFALTSAPDHLRVRRRELPLHGRVDRPIAWRPGQDSNLRPAA